MNQRFIALAGATVLLMLGCLTAQNNLNALELKVSQQNSDTQMSQSSSPNLEQTLAATRTKFGFNLLSQLRQGETNKNIFISPSSVALALSMVYNGANGDTQQEIAQVLQAQGLSLEDFNQASKQLSESLQKADPKVKLAIANSLWLKQGFAFVPEFLANNQTYYQAKVTELDFADATKSLGVINGWVKENTNGKIEQIVDSLRPDDVLFLINAIYFKGTWSQTFDAKLTEEKPFSLGDGKTKQVPLMQQKGEYVYYQNEQFQAVSLPYGNRRLSMYIFLPRENSSLDAFLGNLNADNWQQWVQKFRREEGSIEIPRFKLEYEAELTPALRALGINKAFTGNSDFSNMTKASVLISAVKHKTFVEVNEEGTEAAAATSIGIRATSVRPSQPFNMVVNRPFFAAIRDNETGEILFMGAIFEPK